MTNVRPEVAALRRVMVEEAAASPGASGTTAPLRVAVITPYHRESEALLTECHRSVLAQSHPCTHLLVADGNPAPFVNGLQAQHLVLPQAHADFGDTPRAIGSISAIAQGFDAITYLDADNWYDPAHIATMVELHQQNGASVCVASRSLHRLDGSILSKAGEGTDGGDHVDTNCLFLTAAAYRVVTAWSLMPRRLHAVGDRVAWAAVRAFGFRVARCTTATVRYRTAFRVHYEERGEVAPPGAKDNAPLQEAMAWWRALPESDRQLVFKRLGFRF